MIEFYTDIRNDSKTVNLELNTFHQKLPFNAVHCGYFNTGDKYFTRRDGLNNYLMLITTDGRGEMTWKGKTCILNPGSAVLIDCNILHEYRTPPNHKWCFYFLHFNAMTMSGYSNVLLKKLTPVTLATPEKSYHIIDELYHIASNTDPKTYFIISNLVSSLLTEMICSLPKSDIIPARKDITELQTYIENNFANEVNIDDFMNQTNLSRHYLIHKFKDQVGISPCQYVHMCRISQSQKLLTTTDLSISQIADIIGYGSVAVFIRHFKSFNKITPNKYRNEFHCW